MSTYNLMYGMNTFTMFVVPALFGVHPEELPRYRDCFLEKEDEKVILLILDRTGKPNRGDYDVKVYTEHPDFIGIREKLVTADFTDDTYAYYRFHIPEKHRKDLELAIEGEITKMSSEFKDLIYKVFPKIEEELKRVFDDEKSRE